jgi:hypothetical protein
LQPVSICALAALAAPLTIRIDGKLLAEPPGKHRVGPPLLDHTKSFSNVIDWLISTPAASCQPSA